MTQTQEHGQHAPAPNKKTEAAATTLPAKIIVK